MKLNRGRHLAYCTNIHRGESWVETLAALEEFTLEVKRRICANKPYAIGLRLSDRASRELSEKTTLLAFQHWLDRHGCYVFTINGFPYGQFHGARVKEQVYAPDWTTTGRVEYTNRLFDLLAQLVPDGVEGSVSTVPGSFKEFIKTREQERVMRNNLWRCVEHIALLSARTGRKLHLGLEPEPLCYLETSAEAVEFFDQLRADRPKDPRLDEHLGVNYDTCHLAVEFEEPRDVVRRFREHGVKISKLHFSSALKVRPTPETRAALKAFADDIYFHQVVERAADGSLRRHRDLDVALCQPSTPDPQLAGEWRIHFHIPLHSKPSALFDTTTDHLLGVMVILKDDPSLCPHIEMETYTWEVLPPELKGRNVVDQLVAEYEWTLARLAERGINVL
ncbi:MAG TPA: metabolite traffic protein EboE [Candidatus Angelobacter sp.]|nr:metabolite traffic protein EboE [Candidatus Angelobacter sp.]